MATGGALSRRRIRVLRVITRLNIGGPALHAALLSTRLNPERFDTLLVAGKEGESEGSMIALGRIGADLPLRQVPSLGRDISALDDVRALAALVSIMRDFRPDIVHTHLAKAGALGRVAARVSGVRTVLHTFHGTVFRRYFGSLRSRAFVNIERGLGVLSTRLIAITPGQRRELIEFGIGDERKVVVMPLGLDLAQFMEPVDAGEARRKLALPIDRPVVSLVARLVPVKNVPLFLRAVSLLDRDVLAVVAGDGEERGNVEREAARLGVADRCRFIGWRSDVRTVYAASDVVALTSLNEGSPVSLIEAMAAGRPVVSTAVGGVPDVVADGVSGLLAPSGDAEALARSIMTLLRDRERRERMGGAARLADYPRYDVSRLLADVSALFEKLVRS